MWNVFEHECSHILYQWNRLLKLKTSLKILGTISHLVKRLSQITTVSTASLPLHVETLPPTY